MTDTPMTPDRERMIRMRRTHCEATLFETEDERTQHTWGPSQYPTQEMCQQCTVMRWWSEEPDTDEAVLLAEIDRLRARVAELEDRPTRADTLAEAAAHFDSNTNGRFATRYFGHQVAAELEAMRADHPAPCRVPDSPDCTCPTQATA